jgi:hypothetical protein
VPFRIWPGRRRRRRRRRRLSPGGGDDDYCDLLLPAARRRAGAYGGRILGTYGGGVTTGVRPAAASSGTGPLLGEGHGLVGRPINTRHDQSSSSPPREHLWPLNVHARMLPRLVLRREAILGVVRSGGSTDGSVAMAGGGAGEGGGKLDVIAIPSPSRRERGGRRRRRTGGQSAESFLPPYRRGRVGGRK